MATRWAARVALAAWLSVLALVLCFANPWLISYWIDRPARSVGRRFSLTVLGYPAWGFPGDPIGVQGGLQISLSLRAVILLMLAAGLVFGVVRSMGSRPGGLGVMVGVWAAVVIAAGLAGLLIAPVVLASLSGESRPALDGDFLTSVLSQAGSGAAYGFWVGWLPGIVGAQFGRRAGRPTAPAAPVGRAAPAAPPRAQPAERRY